ncbi:MAG: hypothetical protein B2I17_03575 [Thermoplasmatales archaeon B_DKE]|nr:MAG: hypothetical protein B2I17_03575 [Thermoplasmatales archaeon B_DKE]
MKNIDVHSHILPTESINELGGKIEPIEGGGLYNIKVLGKSISPMPKGFFDVRERKIEISRYGIDSQIVSPTHHLFMYGEDLKKAQRSSRVQNEGIARVCKENPDTFFGNATLPLQDSSASIEELEYAHSKLEMRGIEIGTNIGGKNLDNESLFPFYQKAQDLNMPIFVHPNDFMGKERLEKYYMGIVVGTIAETTVAVTSILFGRLMEEFPHLKMIFCHGGGAIPFQIGRLRHAIGTRNELNKSTLNVDESMRNIYFDTVVFSPSSLNFLVKETGSENVVLGTDYPFNMGNWNSFNDIEKADFMTRGEKDSIELRNAMKLYKL